MNQVSQHGAHSYPLPEPTPSHDLDCTSRRGVDVWHPSWKPRRVTDPRNRRQGNGRARPS